MCAPCAAAAAANNANYTNQIANTPRVINENCLYTSGLLNIWINAIKCCKESDKLMLIGLNAFQANIHIGNIQSAINYPEDYCYFEQQLIDYQQNILPRIIEYVPECLQ
jgi:hypothetical protein